MKTSERARRLQGIAGSIAIVMTIAASSVLAASEALQETPGGAIRAFCDAFGQAHGAPHASSLDAGEASADGSLP
ncbi:hypothetical protein [Variovorax sp. J22R115]|uniref:hypothetical protein n=1 Tax=Variovorax sp. J22R115 TaxID=3053509 RepID=UPI002575E917|nr:hypothetical protein [Variovorax sp. J22R115]MDM0049845.1 hypothetical protein [Variovorax sp. J22R115]